MIIEGYYHNPFPFEIGDHLIDEDGDECILEDADYFRCHLKYLTGDIATQGDGRATDRTERVHENFRKKE